MITMKPVSEPDVVALLAKGRFAQPLEGYVMTDGTEYLGYCLFRTEGQTVTVLDADALDTKMLDGLVRAAIAKAQNEGAQTFCIARDIEALARWAQVFVKETPEPVNMTKIFEICD